MIQFLAFSFKLLFSFVSTAVYGYLMKKEKDDIVLITLIGLFSTSITAIVAQLDGEVAGFAMIGAIFGSLYITNSLVQTKNLHDRIIIIFSCVIGLIIGIGSIFQSFILMMLIYAASKSSLIKLIDSENKMEASDASSELIDDLVEEN